MKIKIAPSILSANFGKMASEVASLQEFGADLIHCDVMDGVFVNNITFGPKLIADIRASTSLPLDVHLMIVEPKKHVEAFVKAGADIITIHIEADTEAIKTLQHIKALGCKCGIVVNPATPLEQIRHTLPFVDMILLMSVNPGFGGQSFIESVMNKISECRKLIDSSGRHIDLEVDGGITFENVGKVISNGANIIVAGNTIFKCEDRAMAIKRLKCI